MFNQITCSRAKDSRFNEHLLLAGHKMFEGERVKWVRDTDVEDSLFTDESNTERCQLVCAIIFKNMRKYVSQWIYSLKMYTYSVINKIHTHHLKIQFERRIYNLKLK